MEKINIAELLKDCPKGMELDCINYDGIITFEEIINSPNYPIVISIKCNNECCKHTLTKYGQTCETSYNKCIIFPKGKTTWDGFVPPCQFKDGDIVSTNRGRYTFILKGEAIKKESYYKGNVYFAYCAGGDYILNNNTIWHFSRLATEEEKQKLFQAIKDNGYKWNAETKTLEKLIEPKFKVGDIVKSKNCPTAGNFVIVGIEEDNYSINLKNYCIKFKDQDNYELINKPKFKVGDRIEFKYHERNPELVVKVKDNGYILSSGITLMFQDEDAWDLYTGKFDITTLKPFDKVLVRDNNKQRWTIDLFSFVDNKRIYSFVCIGHYADQCIPYKGNEHLLGTTNDCDNYYKTWK